MSLDELSNYGSVLHSSPRPGSAFSLSSTCQHAKLTSYSETFRTTGQSPGKYNECFRRDILIRDEEIKVSHSIQLYVIIRVLQTLHFTDTARPVHRINLKVCINHIILSSRGTRIINFVGYRAEKFKGRCFQS